MIRCRFSCHVAFDIFRRHYFTSCFSLTLLYFFMIIHYAAATIIFRQLPIPVIFMLLIRHDGYAFATMFTLRQFSALSFVAAATFSLYYAVNIRHNVTMPAYYAAIMRCRAALRCLYFRLTQEMICHALSPLPFAFRDYAADAAMPTPPIF